MTHASESGAASPGALEIDPNAYARWRGSVLGAVTQRLEQEAIFGLAGDLLDRSVLDAGCGDGIYSMQAWNQGARVTGVDVSEAMLQAAHRRAETGGATIDFVRASIESLPFGANSFDVVLMVTSLCVIDHPALAIKEAARVLRPGGRLIIGELGAYSLWAFMRRLRGWLGNSFWRNTRFWTVQQLRNLISKEGLRIQSIRGNSYYPPFGPAAQLLWPVDRVLSRFGTTGAAFLSVRADKV